MKMPAFRRSHLPAHRTGEHGVTMILVAVSMVALIAMAALSIDVVTLYLAREEAQRAADAGALAAARVISVSGVTGTTGPDTDPAAWTAICGGSTSLASTIAQAAAQENGVAGRAANHVTVTYSSGSGAGAADCTAVPGDAQFGVNPQVTVLVTRDGMPTLFSRIWSRSTNTVSATATAEVLNPSNSGNFAPGGEAIPVTPRCVKPLIIPNEDPGKPGYPLVLNDNTGAIKTPGIRIGGAGIGIIGEGFSLKMMGALPPANVSYIPALVTSASVAYPACADDSNFQEAIGGCDQTTVYACGTPSGAQWDSSINPGGAGGDTSVAAQCLIHQNGQDVLDPASYPYKITAGPNNPIAPPNQLITSSDSIVTLPIYDDTATPKSGVPITILGFLQVFIDQVESNGNLDVHVLNVAGCGNAASTTLSAPGTSPVPIRLITPR